MYVLVLVFLLGKEEVENTELISETSFFFALYAFLSYSLQSFYTKKKMLSVFKESTNRP